MAYTALYRKWRPNSFESVVGQDHIVKTLTNQIMSERIGHAYLLCGTRGTGKTSTAKIFAKAVNCLEPVHGNPCNRCALCEAMNSGRSMNVIEIDAASNNGVDNIREIREEVRYTPTEGKYKVYIIDEVHMLSTGAFNALLKTLEEPPSHVIFILATTEPHKLPATILSRCQRYDFKRITTQVVAKTLTYYLNEEAIQADEDAVLYVAKAADGSMRDALSILDQCIAFYLGETITLQKVHDVLGAVDGSVLADTIEGIHDQDVKALMKLVETLSENGRDFSQWIVEIMQYLRNMLMAKSLLKAEDFLEMSPEDVQRLKEQGERISDQEIIYYIKRFSELEAKIKFASQKRVLIEIELMKLCRPAMDSSTEGLYERLRYIEKQMEQGALVQQSVVSPAAQEVKAPEKMKETVHIEAIPADIKEAILKFDALIDRFTGLEKAVLTKAIPANLEDNALYIICENEMQKNQIMKTGTMENIEAILEEIHHKTFHIRVLSAEEYDRLAHETKDTTTGVEEAKSLFERLKSKINFDIQQI